MSFTITHVTKFAESLRGDLHWFDLHFTEINNDDRRELAEKFDEIGFEKNPRLTRELGYIRVAHKTIQTSEDITSLLTENGITVRS